MAERMSPALGVNAWTEEKLYQECLCDRILLQVRGAPRRHRFRARDFRRRPAPIMQFSAMAFALWFDADTAWAQGLHEYRPMGAAVIAITDRFRARDFRTWRPAPSRDIANFAGLFASREDLNAHVGRLSRSQANAKNPRRVRNQTPAWI